MVSWYCIKDKGGRRLSRGWSSTGGAVVCSPWFYALGYVCFVGRARAAEYLAEMLAAPGAADWAGALGLRVVRDTD